MTEHRGRAFQLEWYYHAVHRFLEWGLTDVRLLFIGFRRDATLLVTWQQPKGNVWLIPAQQPTPVTLSAVVFDIQTGFEGSIG